MDPIEISERIKSLKQEIHIYQQAINKCKQDIRMLKELENKQFPLNSNSKLIKITEEKEKVSCFRFIKNKF